MLEEVSMSAEKRNGPRESGVGENRLASAACREWSGAGPGRRSHIFRKVRGPCVHGTGEENM